MCQGWGRGVRAVLRVGNENCVRVVVRAVLRGEEASCVKGWRVIAVLRGGGGESCVKSGGESCA